MRSAAASTATSRTASRLSGMTITTGLSWARRCLEFGLLSHSGVEHPSVPCSFTPGGVRSSVAQFTESLLEDAQHTCALTVASRHSWFQCCCLVEKVRKTSVAACTARCRDRAFEVEIRSLPDAVLIGEVPVGDQPGGFQAFQHCVR